MERKWSPNTSKWKAAIERGLDINLKGNENILYLGASSGTSVEQLSLRTKGKIFAVEKSFQMAIFLIKLAEKTKNIFPIFCDAREIEYIKNKINDENIDILFSDIPSFDQVRILSNASEIVSSDCLILFSLKTQSISHNNPKDVKKIVEKELSKNFNIVKCISLEPFHKKHFFFVLKKKT